MDRLLLEDGSRVAVVGGGPSGSFFSIFLLQSAKRLGLRLCVDIFEAKDFSRLGPAGCNHCGGIVSESLTQLLATEGIQLPAGMVQRGIASYTLHTDMGTVRISAPGDEKRIAAVHRGAGPLRAPGERPEGLDHFLQRIAVEKGARLVSGRVDGLHMESGRPVVRTPGASPQAYDLLVGAVGINGTGVRLFEELGTGYHAPEASKTCIAEFPLGREALDKHFGDSMHVFLLDIPRLEFGALIPKGDHLTLVMLGDPVDKALVDSFLSSPEVRACLVPALGEAAPKPACQCFPKINVRAPSRFVGDRVLLLGDCAVTRLYKDGIGAAYWTAKAAAAAVTLEGLSERGLSRGYLPACRTIQRDNAVGRLIFAFTGLIRKSRLLRRAVLGMVRSEQAREGRRVMSTVLWDTFTGSAPYYEVLMRTFDPRFGLSFLRHIASSLFAPALEAPPGMTPAGEPELGRVYRDGETIISQGDPGDCMYVIQAGDVSVFKKTGDREVLLSRLGPGDIFGEMALFDREVRSTDVRAHGEVRLLTVDRKTLLRRIQSDPSLALRILERLSGRVRALDEENARIRVSDRRDWRTRKGP